MAIYSYIFDIAYLPFIMLYLNTLVLAYYSCGLKKTLLLLLSSLAILIFVRLLPIEIDPYLVVGGFSNYSYYEDFCNLFATLLTTWVMRKQKHTLAFLLFSLVTIIPIIGIITMEIIGIWSFIVLCKTISAKHGDSQKNAVYIFVSLDLLVGTLLLLFTNNYYCERMTDIRPSSMHLIQKYDDIYYYVITPIDDNEKKIKQIYKGLDAYHDGNFIILEDKKAAYSFRRSSIRMSLFGVDPLDYFPEDVNEIIVEKENGKILNIKK